MIGYIVRWMLKRGRRPASVYTPPVMPTFSEHMVSKAALEAALLKHRRTQ